VHKNSENIHKNMGLRAQFSIWSQYESRRARQDLWGNLKTISYSAAFNGVAKMQQRIKE
jgi:hypothetical protein